MKKELDFFMKKELVISDKGLLKLVQNGRESVLHYIKDGDKLLSLTQKESNKVKGINDDPNVKIGLTKKSLNLFDVAAVVNNSEERIKEVFNKMLGLKFTHYKKYRHDLVVLELTAS